MSENKTVVGNETPKAAAVSAASVDVKAKPVTKQKQKGVKVLISGLPKTGKSSGIKELDDVMVFNFDYDKAFPFNVPFTTIYPHTAKLPDGSLAFKYAGMKKLSEFMKDKRNKFIKAYKKYPKTVVIDTVTGFYGMMTTFNDKRYTGFDIHKQNTADTEAFNVMLDDLFANQGINVVIVAHAMYNEATDMWTIPSQGQFKQRSGWISSVDYAAFYKEDKEIDDVQVHHRAIGLPCRTLLEDMPDEELRGDFKLQDYITDIRKHSKSITDLEL